MNPDTRAVIEATFDASNQGRIDFGQVLARLAAVQVESYHVDYRCGRTTYYLPDGDSVDLYFDRQHEAIADIFDEAAVRAAILAAQQGRVMYPEFKRLTQRAGCIGYTAWIAAGHVTYRGRRGQTHVERFAR